MRPFRISPIVTALRKIRCNRLFLEPLDDTRFASIPAKF
jgi:hypothetical protein